MIFEKATRLKLRFAYKGALSTEDLWDLNFEALDGLYKNLKFELKGSSEDSLLDKGENKDREIVELKIAIVKHVFTTKQAELNDRLAEAENKAKKQRLLDILAGKQDEQYQNMSAAELEAEIEAL